MSLPPSLHAAIQHGGFQFLSHYAFSKVVVLELLVPRKAGFSQSLPSCEVEYSFSASGIFFFLSFSMGSFGDEGI